MQTEKNKFFFILLLFAGLLIVAGSASEGVAISTVSEGPGMGTEAKGCLSCHSRPGNIVKFGNSEFIDAHVNAEEFKASVHATLPCTRCHPEFAGGKHPKRRFRDKEQYQARLAQACRRCHDNRQLKNKNIHCQLLNKEQEGTAIFCTNCHGSHSIKKTTKMISFSSEAVYCLKCHGHAVTMHFRNRDTVSVTVDRRELQDSVHGKLACSDCHYGFSSEEHPRRNFATRRDYTLAASENCRRCHFDKYTKTMESIHYVMLSQGILSAPVCIDCHGSHGVSHVGRERSLIAKRCQRCHTEIYSVYSKSVHGNALFNENNQDVPVCTDCHTAHTIEDPRTLNYREQIPEICSNCHANKAIVGKYGLSTSVVDSYLSDFHGVTLKFYQLQSKVLDKPAKPMAVCTDCHGHHNIASTIGPEASIVRENLVKRCQKCHTNAPPNFPDSWLSHYQPSFSRAPLVFLITLAYKIFVPILVVGLVLQILLHIWRYVADR